MPVGPHILGLLEDALSECFAYHNQLDALVLRAGLSQDRLTAARSRAEARKGRWPSAPKRFVAQELLEEIRTGTPDDDRLTASLVTAFCRTLFPYAAPKGLEAISRLKQQRAEDAEEAAAQRATLQREREAAQRQKDRAGESKAAARQIFRERFWPYVPRLTLNNAATSWRRS